MYGSDNAIVMTETFAIERDQKKIVTITLEEWGLRPHDLIVTPECEGISLLGVEAEVEGDRKAITSFQGAVPLIFADKIGLQWGRLPKGAKIHFTVSTARACVQYARFGIRGHKDFDPNVFGCDEGVLGFGPVHVLAQSTMTTIVQPQITFKPKQLLIPAAIAPHFSLCDLKTGYNSHFASSDPVPCTIFSDATCEKCADPIARKIVTLPAIEISQRVTLVIRNDTDVAQTFSAALQGWYVHQ